MFMVNEYAFKTQFNFNTPIIKLGQQDNVLKLGKSGCHINRSVRSVSNRYQNRASGKTDTNSEQGMDQHKLKSPLFSTAI